MNYYYNKTN